MAVAEITSEQVRIAVSEAHNALMAKDHDKALHNLEHAAKAVQEIGKGLDRLSSSKTLKSIGHRLDSALQVVLTMELLAHRITEGRMSFHTLTACEAYAIKHAIDAFESCTLSVVDQCRERAARS